MKIAVLTDSTANLTMEQVQALSVTVVPLQVVFGDETFADGVDLSAQAFYQRLETADQLPTTSQPAIGQFVEAFARLLREFDAVLAVLLSAKLSGTLRAAESARELVDGGKKIYIHDSAMADYALGLQVVAAAKMAQAGATPEEIVTALPEVGRRSRAYIVVGTLESLKRGGRIGGAAAMVGTLLQIKPIITLQDGVVAVHEKVRTNKKALDAILEQLAGDVASYGVSHVRVLHSTTVPAVTDFAARVRALLPEGDVSVTPLAPIIGVHTGIGCCGMIYLCDA